MKIKLPEWDFDRFKAPPDLAMLERLNADMVACPDPVLRPASWWMLPPELMNGTMGALLDPWVGSAGEMLLSDADKIRASGAAPWVLGLENYLRAIDYLGCLGGVALEDLADAQWRVTDLGSLIDYLLNFAFLDEQTPRLRVLEIGGGFGRLAEFLALVHAPGIQYVNVDAVPASLMYCHQYLKHRFPDKKVRLFSPEMPADDAFDFLIVPSWHLPALKHAEFDLGVNIESMQEMNQGLVDFYLGLLDKKVRDGGQIYLANSREYKFRGTWSMPDNWKCVFRQRTARAWTEDHPAEIFKKTGMDQRRENALRAAAYAEELRMVRALKG